MSTFGLLRQRRFAPFFLVQFLGALNDNLFKNALVIMLAFKAASEAESGLIVNLAAGLFILPFFLFSAAAGQIGDKFEKSKLMRLLKIAEILIMLLGAVGFFVGNQALLFVTLFLMGTHSAFFGPVKYSVLPQHLREDELMDGNALVENGTFLAILLGSIAGGLLAGKGEPTLISVAVVAVALVGYLAARAVPEAAPTAPTLKLEWNPLPEFGRLWRLTRAKEAVFNSILGISWFWFFGATMLAQMPNFTRHFLHGDESVATLLLAVFSVSIGLGSLLCAKLSRGEIELGLVPIGAAGLTVFTAGLFFLKYPAPGSALETASAFVWGDRAEVGVKTMALLAMIGVSGSLFIVPLYALIQSRSEPSSLSRVIAANNIYNSVFMVGSAGLTMVLFKLGFTTIDIFLYTAILNLVVCQYIFFLIPEFVMRFVIWVLASTIYRLRFSGRDNVPRHGPAVIVANHISFIDWFIVTAACRRPVRFVMDHNIFKAPVINLLARAAKAIPIAPSKEDPAAKERAFARISAELRDGQLVCIFPEGKITFDGKLNPFRPGVERMLQTDAVPVIPMALTGLWGSFFSREGGRAMGRLPKPSRRIIDVKIGRQMPAGTSATALQDEVAKLGA